MSEPPAKKIKPEQEFVDLVQECYDLKFNTSDLNQDQEHVLRVGLARIREILEQTTSSSDVSFGDTRTSAKINWGKSLGLLLEDGPQSLNAIKILTEKLSPGGGLL